MTPDPTPINSPEGERTTARITVIGDALIDVLLNDDGSEFRVVGGAGLNVAEGLLTLRHAVALIATIGTDSDGDTIREFLNERGVDFLPSTADLGTTVATSWRVDGNPSYAFNDAARNRRITFDLEQVSALHNTDAVVITGFPFDDDDQVERLVQALSGSTARIMIDPNPRTGMLADAGRFANNFERVAARAALVKIGDEDSALLYGQDVHTAQRRLHQLGVQTVLATAGALGASLLTEDGTEISSPPHDLPGDIIDTMGAGDACLASAVSSLSQPTPVTRQSLLTRALVIAAATCRHRGPALTFPSTLPNRNLVEQFPAK